MILVKMASLSVYRKFYRSKMGRNKIRYLVLCCIAVLLINAFFWQNLILYFTVWVLGFYCTAGQFLWDRKELKRADFYIRVTRSPQRVTLDLILMVCWAVLVVYCILFIPKEIMDDNSHTILGITVILVPTFYYRNFNDSIRVFSGGIKLPKDRQNVMAWQQIESIFFENGSAKLIFNHKTYKYYIIEDDLKDMVALIKKWGTKNPTLQQEESDSIVIQ